MSNPFTEHPDDNTPILPLIIFIAFLFSGCESSTEPLPKLCKPFSESVLLEDRLIGVIHCACGRCRFDIPKED